jgi:alpha-mannosidase
VVFLCHVLKTVDQYYVGSNNTIQNARVQYILDTVLTALQANPARKFVYVEQAFFQRWWREQDADTKAQMSEVVQRGQLEFLNGGWCMHDEAGTHYISMIDQTTCGHKFLVEQFGVIPRIGWQIDPFGHSSTQAALLSAETGFDGLFFGRIDYQDRGNEVMI